MWLGPNAVHDASSGTSALAAPTNTREIQKPMNRSVSKANSQHGVLAWPFLVCLSVMLLVGCGDEDGAGDAAVCGNDVVDGVEECDGTDLGGSGCAGFGFAGGTLACSSTCTVDTTGCVSCGDGRADANEACDGPDLSGESCSSLGLGSGTLRCSPQCTLDPSGCIPTNGCGDGVASEGEACDGDDLEGSTCLSLELGFVGGSLACDSGCLFDTSRCLASATCGDGVVDGLEECDGELGDAQSCVGLGYTGGELSCADGCTLDTSGCHSEPRCGDAHVDPGESCDGGELNGMTCALVSSIFTGGELSCHADCTFDTSGCATLCGNDILDEGEACDGSDFAGQSCESLALGFVGGELVCTSQCTLDHGACLEPVCGNGVVEADEECDGEAGLEQETCEGLEVGFLGGTLGCSPQCMFDAGGCTLCPREDDVENNDSWQEAHRIELTDQPRQLDLYLCSRQEGEEDWFAVDLVEGDQVAVELRFNPATIDLDLDVYDADLHPVAFSWSRAGGVESTLLAPSSAARFYLRVYHFWGEDLGGDYRLDLVPCGDDVDCLAVPECSGHGDCEPEEICQQGVCVAGECTLDPDEYEENDSSSSAASLADGSYGLSLCGAPDEEDWFTLDLAAAEQVAVEVVPQGLALAVELLVGDQIMAASAPSMDPIRLSHFTESAETLLVRIRSPYAGGGTYDLKVTSDVECLFDNQCASGVCEAYACIAEPCSDHSKCEPGHACRARQCTQAPCAEGCDQLALVCGPDDLCVVCVEDADCRSTNLACVGNLCESTCLPDRLEPNGQEAPLAMGEWTEPGESAWVWSTTKCAAAECEYDPDCGDELCSQGVCVPAVCDAQTPCPSGFLCSQDEAGVCEAVVVCASDDGCPSTRRCVESVCEAVQCEPLTLCDQQDDDWYCFEPSPSGVYEFEATFSHEQGDVDMELYLGEQPVASANSMTDREVVTYQAQTNGELCLRVFLYGASPLQSYHLSATAQGCLTDAHCDEGSKCAGGTCSLEGDTCSTAIAISSLPASVTLPACSLSDALDAPALHCPNPGTGGPDAVFAVPLGRWQTLIATANVGQVVYLTDQCVATGGELDTCLASSTDLAAPVATLGPVSSPVTIYVIVDSPDAPDCLLSPTIEVELKVEDL